jgi:hypothetical protein
MEVSGQLHAPATLLQGKNPWYLLDRRLGGPQSRSGCGGEEKNSQPLPGVEPPITSSNFTLHHRVQIGPGAHPAFYPIDTTSSFPAGKAAGA